jgi:hypothetical protein
VKYQVKVSPAEALLLNADALTYRFTKANTESGTRTMVDENSGTVAVSNLPNGEELPLLNYVNSNNQNTVTDNYTALPADDTVFVNKATEVVVTLPNCAQVIGKRIRIKRLGTGDVVIKDHEAVTVYTINDEMGNIELEATPDSWQAFK